MHDVFISYSSIERRQAYAIRSFLKEKGIVCWMAPESIPAGSNYTREIPVAIRNCTVFLLILSENSQKSPWVLRELDGAINQNKYVLPYLLDEAPMADEFQFLLTGCQWHPSWQENAMETLAERILALLPSRAEPKPAPISETEPEVPAPASQPVVQTKDAVVCPACQSHNTEPLKNGRQSYLPGESVRFILPWLAGLVAYLPGRSILSHILRHITFLVDSYYIHIDAVSFNNLGKAVLNILSLLLCAGVIILCYRGIRKKISQKRFHQGFRASGMLCRDCSKKFRVSIPVMTRFPWEKPIDPVIPLPNAATVCCPSCGTENVIPRKRGEGSFDRKERLSFFPAWLAGAVSILPLAILFICTLPYVPFLRPGMGPETGLNGLGYILSLICTLAGAYGVVQLVRIPLRESIRRKRVRQHVHACGFRCPDCHVDFRLVIPLAKKFPHEISETPADNGIRQGKVS